MIKKLCRKLTWRYLRASYGSINQTDKRTTAAIPSPTHATSPLHLILLLLLLHPFQHFLLLLLPPPSILLLPLLIPHPLLFHQPTVLHPLIHLLLLSLLTMLLLLMVYLFTLMKVLPLLSSILLLLLPLFTHRLMLLLLITMLLLPSTALSLHPSAATSSSRHKVAFAIPSLYPSTYATSTAIIILLLLSFLNPSTV